MVRFDFWNKYFGKYPNKFKREAGKQIEDNTLAYIEKYGKHRWIPVEEIFKETLERTDLFNSNEGKMLFAKSGIRNKINSATHTLRRKGEPIISGKGKRGYKYASEDNPDFIHDWDEKLSAWVSRKDGLVAEYENDKKLIERIIERLEKKKREDEAKKLQEILVKYTKNRESVKEIEEDEN